MADVMQEVKQMVSRLSEELNKRFDEVDTRLKKIDTHLTTIDQRLNSVDESLIAFDNRFKEFDDRFQEIDNRFQKVDDRFQEIDNRFQKVDDRFQEFETKLDRVGEHVSAVATTMRVHAAKVHNGLITYEDQLMIVPLPDGSMPEYFPKTVMELVVAGNEKLIDGSKNSWNKTKSKGLLRAYNEALSESDSEGEGDRENSDTSRRARQHLARVIGVTNPQISAAHLAWWSRRKA